MTIHLRDTSYTYCGLRVDPRVGHVSVLERIDGVGSTEIDVVMWSSTRTPTTCEKCIEVFDAAMTERYLLVRP